MEKPSLICATGGLYCITSLQADSAINFTRLFIRQLPTCKSGLHTLVYRIPPNPDQRSRVLLLSL